MNLQSNKIPNKWFLSRIPGKAEFYTPTYNLQLYVPDFCKDIFVTFIPMRRWYSSGFCFSTKRINVLRFGGAYKHENLSFKEVQAKILPNMHRAFVNHG